ncbi:MAG: hypothetical protein COA99_02760 [Moraxellaceae bacterium]|nr:MAG: hypothetical protein COA99_02760 [Moraxellaceae bacterium]
MCDSYNTWLSTLAVRGVAGTIYSRWCSWIAYAGAQTLTQNTLHASAAELGVRVEYTLIFELLAAKIFVLSRCMSCLNRAVMPFLENSFKQDKMTILGKIKRFCE